MTGPFTIRPEAPADVDAIAEVTLAAFRNAAHSDQTESRIIAALRASGALFLSLVAEDGSEIVGHAAFSPVVVNPIAAGWYGLGPVAVRPDRQERGVGQALVNEGLGRLSAAGASGCVVFGNPSYYSRFGFEADPELVYPGAPAGYFMRRTFRGPLPKGVVAYHESFDVA